MVLDFSSRVAVVTGAGGGLGREYALALAAHGCSVVVNDLGGSVDGKGASRVADEVVKEITAAGGRAVANYDSVVDGAKIVNTALDCFGRLDIVVNNAGILRDKSFTKMTNEEWDIVNLVHVIGAKNVAQAAWPHLRKQRYGRVVNITSTSGLYGNYGQTNYSAAKLAVVGMSNTLALEGKKYGIKVNCIAPTAYTRMLRGTPAEAIVKKAFPAKPITRLIVALCSEECPSTGSVFEGAGNWFAQVKLVRAKGASITKESTAEDLLQQWKDVTNFQEGSDDPIAQREKRGGTLPPRAFKASKL